VTATQSKPSHYDTVTDDRNICSRVHIAVTELISSHLIFTSDLNSTLCTLTYTNNSIPSTFTKLEERTFSVAGRFQYIHSQHFRHYSF